MALSSLTSTLTVTMSWTAAKSLTGANYGQVKNTSNIQLTYSIGTAAANAAANGGDSLFSFITSINASSNATIDLTSMTDIINQATVGLARVKIIVIRLLSSTDDATNGTAATSVQIDTSAANPFAFFDLAGTTPSITLHNGEGIAWWTPSAAGKTVDGTHKTIKITNNDGAVTAKVQTTFYGGST